MISVVLFSNNVPINSTDTGLGGAIVNYENSSTTITSSLMSDNRATDGAAIYNFKSMLLLSGTHLRNNGTENKINGPIISNNKESKTTINNNSQIVNINSSRELILNTNESTLTISDLKVYNTTSSSAISFDSIVKNIGTINGVSIASITNLQVDDIISTNGIFLNDNGSSLTITGGHIMGSTINNAAVFNNVKNDSSISDISTITISNFQIEDIISANGIFLNDNGSSLTITGGHIKETVNNNAAVFNNDNNSTLEITDYEIENILSVNELVLNLSSSYLIINNGLIASNEVSNTNGNIFKNENSNLVIKNSLINENSSKSELYLNNSTPISAEPSNLTITNCLITSNFMINGGVFKNNNNSNLEITSSTISQNKYETTITDDSGETPITTTITTIGGGVLKNSNNSTASIKYCIIWDNIDSNNSTDNEISYDDNLKISISYTCIDYDDNNIGTHTGNTLSNITLDPEFIIYPGYGDFYLNNSSSPCIDAEDSSDVSLKKILAGKISSLNYNSESYTEIFDIEYDIVSDSYSGVIDMGFHYNPTAP